jgi:prepilin-type N-terminal cleavage/methylation domain-containing protein
MNPRTRRSAEAGFTLIEMLATLVIALVLMALALPVVVGAIQNYRLNSVVQQTASLIDLARYSAIRRNMLVSLLQTTQNGNTVLYVDLNGNATLDPNEPLVMIPSDMQIANGQALTPAATSTGYSATINFSGTITFDYRGVVNYSNGNTPVPYFLALGYTTQTQYGTRAVTLTPMGQTKMWTAPAGGAWSGM